MKDELIAAIVAEINMRDEYLEGKVIETIYFGGGTPSAISPEDIEKILNAIHQHFIISPNVEITLEANPDDINTGMLLAWNNSGVNRLSIGIQAFQEDLLNAWNRSHTSTQARNAIQLAQDAGFDNITADLIYGGSGLSDEVWIENINALVSSRIPHISSYALTVEKGTALAHQIEIGKVYAPDDEQGNRQYSILQSMLQENGFGQYEVSNFSLPGRESRHNTSYWNGVHYLGIGPSSHSYNGSSRQWNIANNIQYIDSITNGKIPFEKEVLTDVQRYNELVMTGLRTVWGIDHGRIKSLGEKFDSYLDAETGNHKDKLVKNDFGNWALRPEFYFFADGVAADLFMEK